MKRSLWWSIVVFIFLQGWRATLIPLLAVPVSLIGTFIIFPALGFSINTLSLFGLVLAIGLVVDDAIIVVEAVEHHIDEGMDPRRRQRIKAMEEVGGSGGTAIALILAAVFIPTAFIPGITGPLVSAVRRYHRHFSSHLRLQRPYSVACAGVVCFSSRKPEGKEAGVVLRKAFRTLFNKFFGRTTDSFVHTSSVLIHKSVPSPCWASSIIGAIAVCLRGQQRFPEALFRPRTRATCSWPCSSPMAPRLSAPTLPNRRLLPPCLKTPGVQGVIAVNELLASHSGSEHQCQGFFFVALKPWEVRKSKEEQLDVYPPATCSKQLAVAIRTALRSPFRRRPYLASELRAVSR